MGSDKALQLLDPRWYENREAVLDRLFGVIRALRTEGASVIYISHRLDEIFEVADRVTVLKDGQTVGAALTLLDWNQVLINMGGRLFPTGWFKFLTGRNKITRVRVFALGVKPEYQHTGVAAKFYVEHFDVSARSRIKWGEMGWILESNRAMNRGMEAMNGRIVKRYRVYERELAPAA